MTTFPGRSERRATVVGLGLIGGSIAAGLRRAGWWVTGCDRARELERRALADHVVDAIGTDTGAKVAFVATPTEVVVEVAGELLARSSHSSLVVSDVASVKLSVVTAIGSPRFLGGHPMAGSEAIAPAGWDPDLFAGRTWVVTPTTTTATGTIAGVATAVADLGATLLELAPERHDLGAAVVSHVPYLVAVGLVELLARTSEALPQAVDLVAGGFLDGTRTAAGSPLIWPGICAANRPAILAGLDELLAVLAGLRSTIALDERGALAEQLGGAQALRSHLGELARRSAIAQPPGGAPRELAEDRPGCERYAAPSRHVGPLEQ